MKCSSCGADGAQNCRWEFEEMVLCSTCWADYCAQQLSDFMGIRPDSFEGRFFRDASKNIFDQTLEENPDGDGDDGLF